MKLSTNVAWFDNLVQSLFDGRGDALDQLVSISETVAELENGQTECVASRVLFL